MRREHQGYLNFKVETMKDKMVSLCSKMYYASDESENDIKFSCKGIRKAGNDMCYTKLEDVLLKPREQHPVLNKGFKCVLGYMKSYEQVKKGLSYVYHKRIVQADGITTKPLNI